MSGSGKNADDCCPKFDPTPFEEKEHVWKEKMFIVEWIPQFMHMPLPGTFGKAVGRMWKKIEDAGAAPDMKDFLMIAHDPSPWKSNIHINVTKEVPDAKNVTISGRFLSKVFDGPFNEIRTWIKDMEEYVNGKREKVKKLYVYYTTCPKCALKYGHNYVVMFAQV